MKTELKDVLYLYLGCEANVKFKSGNEMRHSCMTLQDLLMVKEKGYENYPIKPILRPLSDMTEEERHYLNWDLKDNHSIELDLGEGRRVLMFPTEILYLIKQGFDLFGLIESGQAIDKTKL